MKVKGKILEGNFRRECRMSREAIDPDTRSVELSFSSEEPYKRWFGEEILGHDPSEVRMERLESGAHPLLLQHDTNQQIGVIEKAWLDGEDMKGRATVRFAPKSNRLAEEVYQDVVAGIRSLVSVGYRVHEFKEKIPIGEDGEPDPDKTKYRAVDWEPFEVSIVSIPADTSVGVGKADQDLDKPQPKEPKEEEELVPIIKSDPLPNPVLTTRTFMDPTEIKPTDAEKERIQLEEANAKKKAETEARANAEKLQMIARQYENRVKEIYSIAQQFDVPDSEKDKAIKDDWSVDRFRAHVLENMKPGVVRPFHHETETGNSGKSLGQLFVESPMYRELCNRGGTRRNITLQIPRTTMQERVFVAATEGLTSIQKLPGVPGLLDQQILRVAQIIPQSTTDSTTIRYIREDTYTNSAEAKIESIEKPEADLDVSEVDAAVRKIAVFLVTTDEMLADHAQMRGFIDGRLAYMVASQEENYILNGTGVNPQITGLFTVAGIGSLAAGAYPTMPDAIGQGINSVRVNGNVEPDAIIMHPNDWTDFILTKDLNGQYYAGGPFTGAYGQGGYSNVGRMFGLPVVTTTWCTEGTSLIGAFQMGCQIFRKQGITLEASNSDEDNFRTNRVTVRCEERMTLACYKPLAFCEITGIA